MSVDLIQKAVDGFASLGVPCTQEEISSWAGECRVDEDCLSRMVSLLEAMGKEKDDRVFHTLMRLSRLPDKDPKTFENFDFSRLHDDKVEEIKSLQTLAFMYNGRNIVFIGDPGTGKSHLAIAIGRECCAMHKKVYYTTLQQLLVKLNKARDTDTIGRVVRYLAKPSLLIIDEFGNYDYEARDARLLFLIFNARYGVTGHSMVITTNELPSDWGTMFRDEPTMEKSMDRIFDDSIVIQLKGESYRGRKKEVLKFSVSDMLMQKTK